MVIGVHEQMGIRDAPAAPRANKKEATDPKAQLNELGEDGWELVTSVEYAGGGTKHLLFKRPVNQQ